MAHDLEAVIQAAVVLTIDALTVGIGDFQQLPGLIIRFAAFVQLQFHTHVERVGAVEDRVGLV